MNLSSVSHKQPPAKFGSLVTISLAVCVILIAGQLEDARLIHAPGLVGMFAFGAPCLLFWMAFSGGQINNLPTAEQHIALLNECLQLTLEAEAAELWRVELKTGLSTVAGTDILRHGMAHGGGTFWRRLNCVHPDDIASLRDAIAAAEQNGAIFRQEFRALLPDTRWLRAEGRFFYSQEGEPDRMLCLIRDVDESRQASELLARDDEEFSLAFEAAGLGCWSWSSETGHFTVNAGTRSILGLPPGSEVTLDVFFGTIHPDERERIRREWEQFQNGRLPFSFAYRVVWPDGAVHSVEVWGHAYDDSGKHMQAIGVALDVTNRKTTEEALRTVSGRLIQAQEEERVRIARELHDDIGQRIALLAVELKRLKENPELSGEQLQQDIEYLAQLAAATASSVQVLSRTLHSSKLEILGISAAMKSLCAEFGRQNRTPIEFVSDVSYSLPQNISLCLYRVLQEGLHNAVKYSGAQQIFVRLHADPDSVELTIRDSGTGFDLETVAVGGGLGLISMQERVHLVNGTIAIESAPGRGTTIRASIPFEESNAARCA